MRALRLSLQQVQLTQLKKQETPAEKPAPPEPSNEEKLLTEIRDLLKEK